MSCQWQRCQLVMVAQTCTLTVRLCRARSSTAVTLQRRAFALWCTGHSKCQILFSALLPLSRLVTLRSKQARCHAQPGSVADAWAAIAVQGPLRARGRLSAANDAQGMGLSVEDPYVQGQHIIWRKDQPGVLEQLGQPEGLHGVIVLAGHLAHILHARVAHFHLCD